MPRDREKALARQRRYREKRKIQVGRSYPTLDPCILRALEAPDAPARDASPDQHERSA